MGKYIFLIVFWLVAVAIYIYIRIRTSELLKSLESISLDIMDENYFDDYRGHLLKKLISKRINNIDTFMALGALYTFVIGLMVGVFIVLI